MDNAIHWITHYLADSVVCFANTYPVDSIFHPLNNPGPDVQTHSRYNTQLIDPTVHVKKKSVLAIVEATGQKAVLRLTYDLLASDS